jgi:hypothetical protein
MLPVVLLSTLFASTTIDANTASLMTDLVTTAFSEDARLDVISSADVKRQLAFEAEKQVLGCSADESCLAEIAAAMGARFVVHGQLGTLDDVVVLTLNLFDSDASQAAARAVVKDRSLDALSDKIDPAVQDLVGRFLARVPAGTRPRVLVLSITPPQIAAPAMPPAAPPAPATATTTTTTTPTATTTAATTSGNPALWWTGLGSTAIGTFGVLGGWFLFEEAFQLDAKADDIALPAVDARRDYTDRNDKAVTGLIVSSLGASALVTGGTLMILGSGE